MPISLPSDFAAKIAETLNWKLAIVDDFLEFSEDKQGFFWAKLKPKKFLDKPEFIAVCKLTKSLEGEDYLQGARAWKVPGPFAKKGAEKPSGHGTDSEATYKEARNAIGGAIGQPKAAHVAIKPGYYEHFPIGSILSPQFTLRLNIQDDIKELVEQIGTTHASGEQCVILEPLVCRPAKQAGDVEVAAGERRLLASRTIGLNTIPVIVKEFSDEEFDRVRLMENFARKDLSDYEVARALKYLLDKYPAVYPSQANLADVFGKTQQWVSQHLQMLKPEVETITTRVVLETGKVTEHQAREILAAPEEKKAEIIDKINETGKVPSVREIHEIAHPEKKVILCARCGFPIEGPPVHLGEGKFYDAECAEQEVVESKKGLISEPHTGPFEEDHVIEPEVPSRAKAVAVQIGTFECTECKQHFIIEHLPNGKHKLKQIRSVPP